MRAWSVVVPRERAEEIRRDLLAQGLLLESHRIVREGDRILLPTRRRVDLGFPTEEREFEQGYIAVRSYRDIVEVPAALRRSLPSSFDVVGDVAVIRLPEELRAHRSVVGEAILRWNAKIRVVMEDRGVAGAQRVRQVEIIAGEPRSITWHVEHGLRYRVDLARAYFSPRLATERQRIASLVREGEVVADPFAGVGPYAILIAKRRRPREVHASDANPVAVDLLRANVAANRISRIAVHDGDARTILRQIAPVDRIILDLPHTGLDFLPDAFRAIRTAGTVHLYGILERAEEGERQDAIRATAHKSGMRVSDTTIHHVRAYSPSRFHTAFDITVARV